MARKQSKAHRVIFICSVSPFPKTVGKTLMIGGICEFLRDSELVSDLKLMCFEPVPVGCGATAELLPRPSLVRKLANILLYSLLRRTKSLQESFYWSPGASRAIASAVDEFRPDIVIYDTVRVGQFRPTRQTPEVRHVLYMDDLFSVRYERILGASRENSSVSRDALGNFAAKLPRPLMFLYDQLAWLRCALLKVETTLVSATENRCPSRFDKCLLISRTEAETLRARTSAGNILDIPPRIEGSGIQPERTWDGSPDFVFLGSLNLSHNAFGIEHFLQDQLPGLLAAIPGLKIRIVGKGASRNLYRLAAQYPDNVILMGFVEDADSVLSRCCAMLSPLTFGSGIKIKAIDALRCGIPLISTILGVEGMDVGSIAGVKVVADTTGFLKPITALLDQDANRQAGNANREGFQRLYASDVVDRIYEVAFLNEE